MRIGPLVLSIVLVAAAGAQTQPGPPSPFESTLKYFARQLGLPDLRNGIPAGDAEVRIWSGFGLTGETLIRAVRHGGRWVITRHDDPSSPTPNAFQPWIADSVWRRRWTRTIADSFAALPQTPRRPDPWLFVDDGWGVVIEAAEGKHYHIAGADNPQSFCSADDQRMLRVIAPLGLGVTTKCVTR